MGSSLRDYLSGVDRSAAARIAVMGIGNELNGDDAAGVMVVRELSKLFREDETLSRLSPRNVLIVEAGPAPEAFTGPLRRFAPSLILLIDAAELGETPGTVACFDWSATQGMSASTHTLPPSMLASFLVDELQCQVTLVGIQPKHLEFDREVSPEAAAAVDHIVRELTLFFKNVMQL